MPQALARLVDVSADLVAVARRQDRAAREARALGASWAQIGNAVGISKQAAQKRYDDN